MGVLNRLVLNRLGGSFKTSAKQKRDRDRDSQPRPRPRLISQPQGATKEGGGANFLFRGRNDKATTTNNHLTGINSYLWHQQALANRTYKDGNGNRNENNLSDLSEFQDSNGNGDF